MTSAHCHQASPNALSEMRRVEIVATLRRRGRLTSDDSANRPTAPPSMTMTGRIVR